MQEIRLLLEHRPFIESLARRLAEDQNEADDVVQDTWMVVLNRTPSRITNIKGWLGTVVRSQVSNRARSHRSRIHHEASAPAGGASPSTEDVLTHRSIQTNLHAALSDLDAPYREVIMLRFLEGLPPREIAARLGVPVETVRTRARRALAQLRARLDEDSEGGRSAWALVLLRWADAKPQTTALASSTGIGAGWMTLLAALPTLVLVLWALPEGSAAGVNAVAHAGSIAGAAAGIPAPGPIAQSTRAGIDGSDVTLDARSAGTLNIALSWQSSLKPAAGVELCLREANGSGERLGLATDADGTLSAEGLTPGLWTIAAEYGKQRTAAIRAGEVTTLQWEIAPGKPVRGIARFPNGPPASGASIMASYPGDWTRLRQVATADPAGWFETTALDKDTWIGARRGEKQSKLVHLPRAWTHLAGEIELIFPQKTRRTITITVVDAEGQPVEGAEIEVMSRLPGTPLFTMNGNLCVNAGPEAHRTDSEGKLVLEQMQGAPSTISARARGHAPKVLEIPRQAQPRIGSRTEYTISLARGALIEGVVSTASGRAVADARVTVELGPELGTKETQSDADGHFRITGLPSGTLDLIARSETGIDAAGCTRATLTLRANEVARWNPVLDVGSTVFGRVMLPSGQPAVGWHATIRPKDSKLAGSITDVAGGRDDPRRQWTDDQGRFAFAALPGAYVLRFRSPGSSAACPEAWLLDARPGPVEQTVHVRDMREDVRLSGFLVDPNGSPVDDAELLLTTPVLDQALRVTVEPGTGYFEIGPLPPIRFEIGVWAAESAPCFSLARVELQPGQPMILDALVIPNPASLVLNIVDPDGRSIDQWGSIRIVSGNMVATASRTPSPTHFEVVDGTARFPQLRPGLFDLRIITAAYSPRRERFELLPGQEHTITCKLEWPETVAHLMIHLPVPDSARTELTITVHDESGALVQEKAFALPPRRLANPIGLGGLKPGVYQVRAIATADGSDRSCGSLTLQIPSESTSLDRTELQLEACD